MINFVCVYKTNPDGIYDLSWVEKLRLGLQKHFKGGFNFYCLTDCNEAFEGKILLESDSRSWWSKLEIFRKDLFKGPTMYLDLDTVICGDITSIVNGCLHIKDKLVMIQGKSGNASSCIMYWNCNLSFLYDRFLADKENIMNTYVTREKYGDQAFIADNCGRYIFLQDIVEKGHVVYEGVLAKNAKNCRIILFAKPTNKPYTSAHRLVVENWQHIDKDYSDIVEDRRGWTWPKADKFCWKYMRKWPNIPEELSRHVDIKGTVLQAGGNCGFYARKYAEIFNKVITVEPDLVNFYCLLRNTRMHNHVHPYRAALGDKGDFISLELPHEKNVGTYFVSGQGNIPQITIDGMKLKWCNLIHLDIEGYELFALQGAKQTLQRCQPTVALEYNKLANKFGYDINDLDDFFEEQDYKKVAQYDNDIVYIPK